MWWIIVLNCSLILLNLLLMRDQVKRGERVWWIRWVLVIFLVVGIILNLVAGVTSGFAKFEDNDRKAVAIVQGFGV